MPPHAHQSLRSDAQEIWRAAVAAVDSCHLVRESLIVGDGCLRAGDDIFELDSIRRIIVVGCGKAGAGMAAGVETALAEVAAEKNLTGWINVPADCVKRLERIHLHSARPAGRNEPTAEGVAGSEEILRLVSEAAADDLVLCLISGGGSALMPAPIAGVSLNDKQNITRFLSAAGANITELNTVRKALSRVKGGGLLRACRARRLVSLVVSDVLGDPLDVIASGPTVESTTGPAEATAVLRSFHADRRPDLESVFAALERLAHAAKIGGAPDDGRPRCTATNLVIGNNAVAVDAAGVVAERLGYSHAMISATSPEGPAEDVGRHLAEMAVRMLRDDGPDCLISGGEPTVRLADEAIRGKGGRNQQLVLAAAERLLELGVRDDVVVLSGGTDGEDGPTDAAGAVLDTQFLADCETRRDELADALSRNDAYTFFEPRGALIKTGPTHTNVCDVRVVAVNRRR